TAAWAAPTLDPHGTRSTRHSHPVRGRKDILAVAGNDGTAGKTHRVTSFVPRSRQCAGHKNRVRDGRAGMKIVAIDQGTTSTKGVVVDENGHGQPLRGLRHAQFMPEPGWIEQDPRELLDNVRSLIELGAGSGAKGIALANQGETVVAW